MYCSVRAECGVKIFRLYCTYFTVISDNPFQDEDYRILGFCVGFGYLFSVFEKKNYDQTSS